MPALGFGVDADHPAADRSRTRGLSAERIRRDGNTHTIANPRVAARGHDPSAVRTEFIESPHVEDDAGSWIRAEGPSGSRPAQAGAAGPRHGPGAVRIHLVGETRRGIWAGARVRRQVAKIEIHPARWRETKSEPGRPWRRVGQGHSARTAFLPCALDRSSRNRRRS